MAQRNPMNERYQGDGPQGKTKKSASKLKPKTQAAASVHIESKPTNKQERKAASRRREAEEKRKIEEHARKQAEREKAQRIAAGLEPAEPKKKGILAKILPKKPAEVGVATATSVANASATNTSVASESVSKTSAGGSTSSSTNVAAKKSPYPSSPEYKKWRTVYWVLLAVGIVFVAVSFFVQMNFVQDLVLWGPVMGGAYVFIIAALVVDFSKVRPLVKKHQAEQRGGAKKSPKQIKHEEEAAARAREIEEYNKARKLARKNRGQKNIVSQENHEFKEISFKDKRENGASK